MLHPECPHHNVVDHTGHVSPRVHLLPQLHRQHAPRLELYTLAPELRLGIDGAFEHKLVVSPLRVEGGHWGMVTNLKIFYQSSKIFYNNLTKPVHKLF